MGGRLGARFALGFAGADARTFFSFAAGVSARALATGAGGAKASANDCSGVGAFPHGHHTCEEGMKYAIGGP